MHYTHYECLLETPPKMLLVVGVLYANYKQTGKHDHKSVSSIL